MTAANASASAGSTTPVNRAAGAAPSGQPQGASAAGDGTAKPNWRDTARGKYEIIHLGVGKANAAARAQLDALAQKLGCRPNALIWSAINNLLASPPTVAPAGATASQGSASGYWVVAETDANGRGTRIRVVNVGSRTHVKGRTFFHFNSDDVKHQGRAMRQAVRAAQHDAKLLGLPTDIKVEEFDAYRTAKGPGITDVGMKAPAGSAKALPEGTPVAIRGG